MAGLGKFLSRTAQTNDPGNKELRDTLLEAVLAYETSRPRSTQIRIGPSEIGEPCLRKLAYKLSGFAPPEERAPDPWFAIMGTAVHAWLADALGHQNKLLNRERWIVEQTVQPRHLLTGSCDAYDTDTNTVVDHKVVGKTNHDKYRREGLSKIYRVQAQLYGLGMANAGHNVKQVAIALYPRFTDIAKGLHVIAEPYDPETAQNALHRLTKLEKVVEVLQPHKDPSRFTRIPMAPGPSCRYCPFVAPNTGVDTGETCNGNFHK